MAYAAPVVSPSSRRESLASIGSSSGGAVGQVYSRGVPGKLRLLIVRHGETDYNVKGIIQGQLDTDLNAVGRRQAQLVAASLATEHIDEVYASPLRRAKDTADAIVVANPNYAHERLIYWTDDRLKERGFGSLEGGTFDRSKPKRDSIDGIEKMDTFAARLASFVADVVVRSAPFEESDGKESEWVDESSTKPARPEARGLPSGSLDIAASAAAGPPPLLHRAGCSRTVALVAHGAAISALVGAVLLDSGLAGMSAGVQRTRIWNCSITEVIVDGTDTMPRIDSGKLDLQQIAARSGKKAFVIERWADVRHLPDDVDDASAAKGSADEMVGRAAS